MYKHNVSVKGIGGDIFSDGYIYLNLQHKGFIFTHKFLVFRHLPCKTCGILGQDFLKKYRAVLNFELNTLKLLTQNEEVVSLTFDYLTPSSNAYLTIYLHVVS